MKKRVIFQVFLALLILFLGYVLYLQIEEPIAFEAAKMERRKAVENELINIKAAQKAYRDITGNFAPSYQKLVDTLNYGKFPIVTAYEDVTSNPDNPVINYDTVGYVAAIDSITALGIELEDIGKIPFTDNDTFLIFTENIEYQQTEIQVIRVEAKWNQFMGRFADKRFKKYDEKYDPNKTLGFGSRSKPILSGSWE